MKKSELQSLTVGMWIVSKKDNSKHQITAVVEETGKIGLDGHKVYTFSTIQRWYDVAKAQNGGLEPEDIVTEDTTQVEDTDTTVDTDTTTTTATNTQGNEIHENTEQTGQQDVVKGNTATTGDKITKDDIIYIIEHSSCDAVVKKQYIGAYREDYKGAVVMVRTTKKGNTHIDMKQGIFNSLAESTRNKLEVEYEAKVYDSTRGYIRLFEVDDLRVLQDLILAALKIA